MAISLFLSTVAHHCHRTPLGQFLNQAKSELLSTVFDDSVLFIEAVTLSKLLPIKTSECWPCNFAALKIVFEFLARRKIGHPHVVFRFG